MATIETITVAGEGITLSQLIWRRFLRPMPDLVDQALAINPGLAGVGPFLPVGAVVRLPVPVPEPLVAEDVITLWD